MDVNVRKNDYFNFMSFSFILLFLVFIDIIQTCNFLQFESNTFITTNIMSWIFIRIGIFFFVEFIGFCILFYFSKISNIFMGLCVLFMLIVVSNNMLVIIGGGV